jgi:hypothetical protein
VIGNIFTEFQVVEINILDARFGDALNFDGRRYRCHDCKVWVVNFINIF